MKVDETHPPTDDKNKWERGLDPWHRDAFPNELKQFAPRQSVIRASGWYELDWCGNVIGFVLDGTKRP